MKVHGEGKGTQDLHCAWHTVGLRLQSLNLCDEKQMSNLMSKGELRTVFPLLPLVRCVTVAWTLRYFMIHLSNADKRKSKN